MFCNCSRRFKVLRDEIRSLRCRINRQDNIINELIMELYCGQVYGFEDRKSVTHAASFLRYTDKEAMKYTPKLRERALQLLENHLNSLPFEEENVDE